MYDPMVSKSSHKEKQQGQAAWLCFLLSVFAMGLEKAVFAMSVDLYALIAFIFMALTGMANDFFSIQIS